MVGITNTNILSTFPLIRAAIVANSTLSTKFGVSNIYEFEPKHKSASFKGFPYFWVNLPNNEPNNEPDTVVFDNSFHLEDIEASVLLRIDYLARDKVRDYANAFLKAINDYESTFQSSGYYDVKVSLIDVNPNQRIEQKEIVEVEFLITFRGQVRR